MRDRRKPENLWLRNRAQQLADNLLLTGEVKTKGEAWAKAREICRQDRETVGDDSRRLNDRYKVHAKPTVRLKVPVTTVIMGSKHPFGESWMEICQQARKDGERAAAKGFSPDFHPWNGNEDAGDEELKAHFEAGYYGTDVKVAK